MSDTNDNTAQAQRLLETVLGATLVADHKQALDTGPGPVRLSAAFAALEATSAQFTSQRPGELHTEGAAGLDEATVQCIRYWRPWILRWYWMSPTAILECDRCGEVRVVGSKKTKKCNPSQGASVSYDPGIAKAEERWSKTPKKCEGTLRAIEPPFAGRRPRPRKIKVGQ